MKNNNTRLLLSTVVVLLLLGCSKEAKQQDDTSSGNGLNEPYLTCSAFANETFSGKIQAYKSSSAATVNPDLMRLTLDSWPAGFETDSTMNLKFFVWKVNANGVKIKQANALAFNFENKSYPGIRLGNFQGENDFTFQAFENSNVDLPIGKVAFELAGTGSGNQVLTIEVRTGTTVVSSIDILMPTFQSNPAAYINQKMPVHPAMLYNLHPFISYLNSGYTSDDFLNLSESYCIYSDL